MSSVLVFVLLPEFNYTKIEAIQSTLALHNEEKLTKLALIGNSASEASVDLKAVSLNTHLFIISVFRLQIKA